MSTPSSVVSEAVSIDNLRSSRLFSAESLGDLEEAGDLESEASSLPSGSHSEAKSLPEALDNVFPDTPTSFHDIPESNETEQETEFPDTFEHDLNVSESPADTLNVPVSVIAPDTPEKDANTTKGSVCPPTIPEATESWILDWWEYILWSHFYFPFCSSVFRTDFYFFKDIKKDLIQSRVL